MKISKVTAHPISFLIPSELQVSLGIGRAVKRDAVLVEIETDDGIVGWGEAHAARAPTALAELVNTTLRQLVCGLPADDIDAVWERVYRMQIASHGMGAAATIGLSGIDMALWDIRGKAAGKPLHRLLGSTGTEIPAYAGGVSLGYQPVPALLDEVAAAIEGGYRAIKLRIGDSFERDTERVRAVRNEYGNDVTILTDANCRFMLGDARRILPVLDECGAGWLEEPFPAPDFRAYRTLGGAALTPIAAGENHYTRFDFERALDDGVITVWQPDLSKCGGMTEALRIASIAQDAGISVSPHTSVTGLNHATTIHFLAGIANRGYFEADVSRFNPFRTEMSSDSFTLRSNGTVAPLDGPGIGVEIDADYAAAHPAVAGPGYV